MKNLLQVGDSLPIDASGAGNNVLSKRLNKVLETRVETDKETLEALKELSTFFIENTLQSRRNLRSKIEKRSVSINGDFLSAFRRVKHALDTVYNDVATMDKEVQNMSAQLQATRAQTHQLIENTMQLQSQSKKLSMEQEVATAFLKRFQLSQTEVMALHGTTRDGPITPGFFTALQHAQSIHTDCRILMQSGFQTAALDIMEQMSLYQEAALERLYRWTQAHCRNMDSGDTAAILTEAMACLEERPVLFKYVLDEYSSCRRAVLVEAFINALTKGGPGGSPRPIELHADDPKRYVGDMLAWLHQAIPSEKDAIQNLLRQCSKTDEVEQVLANISEGVCNPVKVRVERILSIDASTTILYSVSSLLGFYHQVIGKQVVPQSALQVTLSELQTMAQQRFLQALQARVKQHLTERLDAPPPDLAPSPGVCALLGLLKEVLSVAGVAEDKPQDIAQMVAVVLDPLLQAVNVSASRLPTTDMAVYLLNCLYQMQATLSLYGFMDDRLERLQAQSDAQIDTLTSEQASSLVANLTLGPIYTILQEQSRGPLSNVPGMDATSLKHFLVKFNNFLSMPDILMLPQTSLLLSSAHRLTVQQRAFEVICTVYRQIYTAVKDPKNEYENPDNLISRPPEEVEGILLGKR